MGCDGGSIAGRKDLVQTRTRPSAAHVDAKTQQRDRLTTCALSHEPLRAPIVICALGHLYNKSSVLEYLLAKKPTPSFAHIRSIKDVRVATVVGAQASTSTSGSNSASTPHPGMFVCPVTGLPSSGQYRFVCLHPCGCVLSETALRRVRDAVCMVCNAVLTSVPSFSASASASASAPASASATDLQSSSSSSSSSLSSSMLAVHLHPHTLVCPSWEERDTLQQHLAQLAATAKASKGSSATTKSKRKRVVESTESTAASSSSSSSTSSSSSSSSSSEVDAQEDEHAAKKKARSSHEPPCASASLPAASATA